MFEGQFATAIIWMDEVDLIIGSRPPLCSGLERRMHLERKIGLPYH